MTIDNKMIIYEKNELKFESFGKSVITDAYDINIKHTLNGEHSLTFYMPIKSVSYNQIIVGRFIKAYDTVFIIRSYEEYSNQSLLEAKVYCEHILFELIDEFIPFLAHRNSAAQYMLNSILSGTRFKGTTTIKGAYNLQVSKGSKLKDIDELCENVAAIRLCSNMPDANGFFHITLIPIEGIAKGTLVHNRKNLSSMRRIVEGKNVITRLYVYGEEGIGIEEAQSSKGKAYIDSSNILDYPKAREGAVSFDTINDPDNLYEAGLKYIETVCKPVVSYEVDMESLKLMLDTSNESIEIGDNIRVIDENLNVTVNAKVAEIEWNPEKGDMRVSLEVVMKSAAKVIADILDSQESDTGVRKGNVWTEWLTVPYLNNQPTTIIFSQEYKTKPVVQVQLYGSTGLIHTEVHLVSKVVEGVEIFTGMEVTCSSESYIAEDIAIQAIGRV